jgi:hypothetical protein
MALYEGPFVHNLDAELACERGKRIIAGGLKNQGLNRHAGCPGKDLKNRSCGPPLAYHNEPNQARLSYELTKSAAE